LGGMQFDLLQGTLDMLILRTLAGDPMHGWGIAQRIQLMSGDVLRVNQGSLYPALYRLERQGFIDAEWGSSENNRRAKYYKLTRLGRKRLADETTQWERLSAAIAQVMMPSRDNGGDGEVLSGEERSNGGS
jgi:PadR family transcriptional regulator, regulatory protein PadR